MDRREFLRLSGLGVAAAFLGGISAELLSKEAFAFAERAAKAYQKTAYPDFVVAHGPSVSRNLRSAIEDVGGIARFIAKGDVVVVKPNIGWDRVPEQAATTDPDLVYEMVKMCNEAGAKKVRVFDKTCNDPRRCYVRSRIADSARKAGAEVSFVDDRKFKRVDMEGSVLTSWPVYTQVLECDKLINMPVAKHHGMSRLTMSVKNWMGVIGEPRSRLHQDINRSLADLAIFFKPTLTVLDATRILLRNGPQGGSLKDVLTLDTLVVGTDQIAIDSYGATLFGLKGEDLGYLVRASAAGAGEIDLEKVSFAKTEVA